MSAPVPAGLAVGSLEGGYGSSPVLQCVNFHIEPGEIFAEVAAAPLERVTRPAGLCRTSARR